MSQRVFVTGGTSYLGLHVVPFLVEKGCEVMHSWNSTPPPSGFPGTGVQLNVRGGDQVSEIISTFRPDVILHLAASNRSINEQTMVSSIIEGAENTLSAAGHIGCRIIHMSTDVIFDGTASPYSEDSPYAPKHAYGRAKVEAEKIIGRYANSVIIRPSLIYSLRIKDRSTEWVEKTLNDGNPVTLFTDQIRNPVWTETLAAACHELLDHPFVGVMHVVGKQAISRAEFGDKLLKWWKIDSKGLVQHVPQPVEASWPLDLRLKTNLASEILETPMLGVDEVFARLS